MDLESEINFNFKNFIIDTNYTFLNTFILIRKILSKFTPKLNKLHLTTITLLYANFNNIYSKLHHLFFSQTP